MERLECNRDLPWHRHLLLCSGAERQRQRRTRRGARVTDRMCDLFHDLRKSAGDLPLGIMGPKFTHVGVITNMIAAARIVAEAQDRALSGDLLNEFQALD